MASIRADNHDTAPSPSPVGVTNPAVSTSDVGATWSILSEDTEEEKIKYRIETNKSRIVELVQPNDILVHLSTYFSMEQKAQIFETAKSNRQVATRKAIEIYLNDINDPGRFTAFREAMANDYPNVVKLLSGSEIPFDHSCKKLNKVRNRIVRQLDPSEILPYLQGGVLLQHEAECIRAEEQNYGKIAASRRLLHYLPRHVDDWFQRFVGALKECNQSHVAKLLEDDNLDHLDEEPIDNVPENLAIYESLIAKRVTLEDMQAFIESMCPGKQLSSTSEGLQILLHGLNNPGRFTAFVDEMRTAGYPLVVDLLLGEYKPWNDHYARIVELFTVPLGERIDVTELLPYLLKHGVLQDEQAEEIHQLERNEGKTNAAWLFLLIYLPQCKPNCNWFRRFMEALVDCGHDDIARKLDDITYEKITAESSSCGNKYGNEASVIYSRNSESSIPSLRVTPRLEDADVCTDESYGTYPCDPKSQPAVAPSMERTSSQYNDGIRAPNTECEPAIASTHGSSRFSPSEIPGTPNMEHHDVQHIEHEIGAKEHTPEVISEHLLGARPKNTCKAKERIPQKRAEPWRVETVPSESLGPTGTEENSAGITCKDDPLMKMADIEQDLENKIPLDTDNTYASDVLNLMDCSGYSELQRVEWQSYVREDEIYRTVIQEISKSDFTVLWKTNWTLYDVYQTCSDSAPDRYLDLIYCDKTTGLGDIPTVLHNGLSLSIIQDENTGPGEVKLQAMMDGTPCTVENCQQEKDVNMTADGSGKMCFKPHKINWGTRCNEPYVKSVSYSFRCSNFVPAFAIEMINSKNNLLLKGVDIKQAESFVFSDKFHQPESDQIIWNVSFVTMERLLLESLNHVQYKCLVILEIVMEHLSTRIITEDMHFQWNSQVNKSCIFHLVEHLESDQWHEQNIIQCILRCLLQLMKWIKDGSCPHYFIPDVNLLPLMPEQRMKLQDKMYAFVTTGYKTFFTPASFPAANSDAAPRLQNLLAPVAGCKKRVKKQMCASTINNILSFNSTLQDMLFEVNKGQKIQYLQCCLDVLEKQSSGEVLSNLRPIIHQHQAQTLLSEMTAPESQIVQYFKLGCHNVLMSSRLMYVLALYSFGYRSESKSELRQARDRLNHAVPVCTCLPGNQVNLFVEGTSDAAERSLSVAQCVQFQPELIQIAPDPIQMEMCESKDVVAVDASIFLLYLEYLIFKSDRERKKLAIVCLESAMMTIESVKHPVIAYNLLGWICLQEKEVEKAKQCFKESLKIQPEHNVSRSHLQNVEVLPD